MTGSSLPSLVAAVEDAQVRGLMAGRLPAFVDENDDRFSLYLQTVRGVAAEVAPLTGGLTTGTRWDMAVWAVTLGAAASIEASLYPEQQSLGDQGLAASLNARYQAVLKRLEGSLPDDDGTLDVDGIPRPVGAFPEAPYYPDPVRAGRRWSRDRWTW